MDDPGPDAERNGLVLERNPVSGVEGGQRGHGFSNSRAPLGGQAAPRAATVGYGRSSSRKRRRGNGDNIGNGSAYRSRIAPI